MNLNVNSSTAGLEGLSRTFDLDGGFANEKPAQAQSGHFANMLEQTLNKVNENQVQADHAVKELVAGRTKNIHETMLALERADMSLKLMMQVRNKILDAYREVMKMQV